jgi:hypothetical protein
MTKAVHFIAAFNRVARIRCVAQRLHDALREISFLRDDSVLRAGQCRNN